MVRGLYQNASSMMYLLDKLDAVAHNIANTDTSGYKRKSVFFRQLIDAQQALEKNAVQLRLDDENGRVQGYAKDHCCRPWGKDFQFDGDISTYTDYSAGNIKETGNPLDVALAGDGFFGVQTPDGVGYTRDGQFKIDANGVLVNADGYPIMGEAGPITVSGSKVDISETGEIAVDGTVVNRLMIRTFDAANLSRIRDALYRPDENTPGTEANARVEQGYLETSNVNAVREMVEMIQVNRHYEANSRVMTTIDRSIERLLGTLGRA